MRTRWETTLRESGGGSTAGRAGRRTGDGSRAGNRYFTYEDRRNSAPEPGRARDAPPSGRATSTEHAAPAPAASVRLTDLLEHGGPRRVDDVLRLVEHPRH